MESLDFGKVPGEMSEAADFLKKHVKGRVKTKDNLIEVEGLSHKEAKLLMHKFLRHRGLDRYRVLSQMGVLVVVPPHTVEPSRQETGTGTTPPASVTLPYYFPGRPGPVPTEKRIRRRKD